MSTTSPVLTTSASTSPSSFRRPHPHAHANANARTHHHHHHNNNNNNAYSSHRPPTHPSHDVHSSVHAPAGNPTTTPAAAGAVGPIPPRWPPSRSTSSPSASASASMSSPAVPRPGRSDAREGEAATCAATCAGTFAVADQIALAAASDSRGAVQGSALAPHVSRPQAVSAMAATPSTQVPSSSVAAGAQTHTISTPSKRRVPPAPPAAQDTPEAEADNDEQQASKRARADDRPPKILPQRYELCEVVDIVELISHMLSELITTNDAIRISHGGLTRFHSKTAPGISVRDYLHRLAKHATLTPPLLLAMVYYIDRLCLMYHEFTINTLTVHRFLITAATVAAKGLSDSFWNNTTYARVGGVRLAELKLLELEFLHRVDWKIVPDPEVLVAYYRGLVERTPGYVLESESSSDEDLIIQEFEDRQEEQGLE